MAFHVVYLTGPPASGKTTLRLQLQNKVTPLSIYHYSALLVEHLRASRSELGMMTEDALRERSATAITPEDVKTVDELLIRSVHEKRQQSHVLVDSHAVTKETYGYRITPFSMEKLRALQPTMIVMLYVQAEEIARRISANSGGRPSVSKFESDFHIILQSEVATFYALELGLPLYLYDTTTSVDQAAEALSAKLNDRPTGAA